MTVYAGQWGPEWFLDSHGDPVPSVIIDVFDLPAGTARSTLYVDRDRSDELANPLPTGVIHGAAGVDTSGNATLYAEPGRYLLVARVGGAEAWRGSISVFADPADAGTGSGGGVPPGGGTNQVLRKLSATDGDASWQSPIASWIADFADGVMAVSDPRYAGAAALLAEVARATAAENARLLASTLGQPGGPAQLDLTGKLGAGVLPSLAIVNFFDAGSQAAMLALPAQQGDVAIRSDFAPAKWFWLTTSNPGLLADWREIAPPAGGVLTVDYGAGPLPGNVVLPADAAVGTPALRTLGAGAQQAAQGSALAAEIARAVAAEGGKETPAGAQAKATAAQAAAVQRANHTGSQLAATISDFNAAVRAGNALDQLQPPAGTVSFGGQRAVLLGDPVGPQDAATRAWVLVQIAALVASSPTLLDTLNELAAAIGNDPNFATTMVAALAGKIDKSLADAADDLLVATANDTWGRLPVPPSRILLKKAAGALIAGTPADLLGLVSYVDTAAGLAALNPTMPAGALAYATDTHLFALGDAVQSWLTAYKFSMTGDPQPIRVQKSDANISITANAAWQDIDPSGTSAARTYDVVLPGAAAGMAVEASIEGACQAPNTAAGCSIDVYTISGGVPVHSIGNVTTGVTGWQKLANASGATVTDYWQGGWAGPLLLVAGDLEAGACRLRFRIKFVSGANRVFLSSVGFVLSLKARLYAV